MKKCIIIDFSSSSIRTEERNDTWKSGWYFPLFWGGKYKFDNKWESFHISLATSCVFVDHWWTFFKFILIISTSCRLQSNCKLLLLHFKTYSRKAFVIRYLSTTSECFVGNYATFFDWFAPRTSFASINAINTDRNYLWNHIWNLVEF